MLSERIGNGWFLEGDCLDRMGSLPEGAVGLVLCDLPYGTTQCAWDSVLDFGHLWFHWNRLCPAGAVVLTASQPFTSLVVSSNLAEFSHSWAWDKAKAANFPQVKRHPLKVHEDIVVFRSRYFPQMTQGKMRTKGGYTTSNPDVAVSAGAPRQVNDQYYPKSILDFSIAGNAETGHATQKPVALFDYLIRTYSLPGEIILDNTAGSGTTAIAAERAGRRWICIERDPEYFAKAVERVRQEVANAK